ncbi:MAG: hypothetical protein MR598_06865 [Erysipelotrichaceae bacterium]|nr:hypothetical protein [Erysipelotrichaceae bacterium]
MNEEDKSYIEMLKEIQKENPNLILPSMGMIDNENRVEVNGKDYIKKEVEGEEDYAK